MTRRELLAAACGWSSLAAVGRAQHMGMTHPKPPTQPQSFTEPADITLRIGEVSLELKPGRTVKTLAYNGQVPGPLLRARRGRPVIVDVWNDTREMDIVHWHGLHIPSEVDGVYEQGTPGVPPKGRQRYRFTPDPAGTRWYHSHHMAGRDFKKGTYTGQFGMLVVETGDEPGAYDQEVPILLHEWEPRVTNASPADVTYRYHSINGKMLGGGEPIRVREGQRVLFRMVNASATLHHSLALPGHLFRVIALDGNAVPTPAIAPMVELGPGERVDAIVEMNRPGVWILGETRSAQREAGMGIAIEYAGQPGPPRWAPTATDGWSYLRFGAAAEVAEPDGRLTLVFKPKGDGHSWTINGQSHPRIDPIVVRANRRYRWLLDNQSADAHPIHLHRHTFELVKYAGQRVSGIWKDVVVVPAWQQVEIDVPTTQPGLSLFHCHHQFHMDMGFMTMMRYEP
ncbi:MAG: multicopper oxidase family protein [Acidobacteriota bacterium]|nr:multicopper oxidase family protein [Acidobacteriota bacterium]